MSNAEQFDQDGTRGRSELDRILLAEDALLPSSGFAASVMDVIQQRASEPAPIPFPWKLAIPGIGMLLVAFVVLCRLVFLTVLGTGQSSSTDWLYLSPTSEVAVFLRSTAGPAVLALAASWGCVALCRRLGGGWSAR
jgi:hypothetical protein